MQLLFTITLICMLPSVAFGPRENGRFGSTNKGFEPSSLLLLVNNFEDSAYLPS